MTPNHHEAQRNGISQGQTHKNLGQICSCDCDSEMAMGQIRIGDIRLYSQTECVFNAGTTLVKLN